FASVPPAKLSFSYTCLYPPTGNMAFVFLLQQASRQSKQALSIHISFQRHWDRACLPTGADADCHLTCSSVVILIGGYSVWQEAVLRFIPKRHPTIHRRLV